MYYKCTITVILFTVVTSTTFAQSQKFTIRGTIKDNKTGETLNGAAVIITQRETIGASSNEYGFYSITLPAGNYILFTHYLGFESDTIVIALNQNVELNISLKENRTMLKEIVVSSIKDNDKITSAETGVEKLDIKEISRSGTTFPFSLDACFIFQLQIQIIYEALTNYFPCLVAGTSFFCLRKGD